MILTPAPSGIRTSLFVCSQGKEVNHAAPISPTSGTMTTDLAYIISFNLPTATVIRRLYWANGATAATNTIQVGIYNDDLTSFLLGTATVASGVNALQFDNVTDTPIGAGRYFMALVANGNTTTVMRTLTLSSHGVAMYQMAAARPLPATLVLAVPAANVTAFMPLFGFTSIA